MKTGVLHLVDSLEIGGAERMAVNLANGLSRAHFQPHLCATRLGGPLQKELAPDVQYLYLNRRALLDLPALRRLKNYIRQNHIRLLHAHGTTLFIAGLIRHLCPECKLIWHIHAGALIHQRRTLMMYRFLTRNADAILAVTRSLTAWAKTDLLFPAHRVWYAPNFILASKHKRSEAVELPGAAGFRLVCVANIRPPKDQMTLLRAFKYVVEAEPRAHLFLVGAEGDGTYARKIWTERDALDLKEQVWWLGKRDHVLSILSACDVGVLSSISEGFPLALLEYGAASLAAVATQVGECPEILDYGNAGMLTPPRDPGALADALIVLLTDPERRAALGCSLQKRIERYYTAETILKNVATIYTHVLAGSV